MKSAAKATRSKPKLQDVRFLTEEEGRALFEAAVQRELGMSTEEFLRKLDAGEYDGQPENQKVEGLILLLPFVRKVPWPPTAPTKR